MKLPHYLGKYFNVMWCAPDDCVRHRCVISGSFFCPFSPRPSSSPVLYIHHTRSDDVNAEPFPLPVSAWSRDKKRYYVATTNETRRLDIIVLVMGLRLVIPIQIRLLRKRSVKISVLAPHHGGEPAGIDKLYNEERRNCVAVSQRVKSKG